MAFNSSTRRSLSQVIFRHTPESLISLDEFDVYGRIRIIKGQPDTDVNKDILARRLAKYVSDWDEKSGGRVKGFEGEIKAKSFVAIRPGSGDPEYPSVFCDIFPLAFQCVNSECGVYADSLSPDFKGTCRHCGSTLRQIKYVWFHHCGKLMPFGPLRQITCPKHGRDHLYLMDTGRFSTSRWRCRKCGYEDSLRMLPCSDQQCLAKLTEGQESRFMRGSVWNDSWVYYTQQISFVNLSGSEIDKIVSSPNYWQLLLDSIVGRIPAGSLGLGERANLTVRCQNCGFELSSTAKFCPECGTRQATLSEESKENQNRIPITADSDLAIFASLRDLERTISIKDYLAKESKDNLALRACGVNDILLINDFPLTNAAIGFSRFKSGPPAWLNSFPVVEGMGSEIPVYTNCVTSEAWMVQLSAKQALKWLASNELVRSELAKKIDALDETEAAIWLTGLMTNQMPTVEETNIISLLHDLLHSYSHQTLQLLGTVSGLDSSSLGEMLLPQAMSFIIYSGESDIGGLSATFSQSLNVVMAELVDFLRVCKFDPSCLRDDGGVCAGCLYLARGCTDFNERLSRAYLFGGSLGKDRENITRGFLDIGRS